MVIVTFKIKDKKEKSDFFEKTFPFANLRINVILKMLFFIWGNIDVNFLKLVIS